MKAIYLALALSLAAAASALAAPAGKNVRVDLGLVVNKDFTDRPSLDDAVAVLQDGSPFCGLGWQVVVGHVGFGGDYAADFFEQSSGAWWLDWNAHAFYVSGHLFDADAFLDPYVSAGLGCSGELYLGPAGEAGESLALSCYPFVAAGVGLSLKPLRVKAELSYAPWTSAIPVTDIPEFPLGAFQASVFLGFSI